MPGRSAATLPAMTGPKPERPRADSYPIPSPPGLAALRRALRAWYRGRARDLPWRRSRDPYAILVSEFMLQQTQVTTVLPYYTAFLDRFPSLEALAGATEDSVRTAWSGLGYYRRARNLQAASRTLVRDHGGRLPESLEGLRALPGVGDYTAAALGSIVHGLPKGVVDGNVIRVLTRLAGVGEQPGRAAVRRGLQDLADRLVEPRAPGDWNQAMMELGATVCTPRAPDCAACPWERACRARAAGNPEAYPAKAPARATVEVERAVAVLRRRGDVLLVRRRDPKLLDGTWEFPGVEVPAGRSAKRVLGGHLLATLGVRARVGAELAAVRHAITHRRITVRGFLVEADALPRARRGEREWVRPGTIGERPVSSMTLKVARSLVDPVLRSRSGSSG